MHAEQNKFHLAMNQSIKFTHWLVWLLALALAACRTPTPTRPPSTTTPGEMPESAWFTLYFSDPDSPTAGSFRGGPDAALAQAIREARLSVDAAIYHLNLWSVRDALIAAHQSGVKVRVVMESDNMDEVEAQDLVAAGIEVIGDRRESLMHNKFVVIDGSQVWTGSLNFTVNGAYYNDNNLVCVRSSRLAQNYTREFNEMFERDFFGDNVLDNTPYPSLTIDSSQVETYFSPDDDTADHIVELVRSAQKEIRFLAYSFTSDEIAEAMLERAAAGVQVSGVFEEGQYYSNTGSEFDRLAAAGLDVRLDGNPRNMHHKVILIDNQIVILGSYNFSRNAEEFNDENTLIVHNAEMVAQFLTEFERVWAKAPTQ
jgi:phosphatidylserine/phosphatidylglycerophosphate/cardiolipin synthase-like enzyme